MSDKYISDYTGSQVDEAVGLLNEKGLNSVEGIVKRSSTGLFGVVQKDDIVALGIPEQDTTYESGYGINITNGVISLDLTNAEEVGF